MTNARRSTNNAAPVPSQIHAIPPDTAASTNAGGPAPEQAPKTETEEDALIFAEIDRVLAKAMAMARYFGQDAVENALALASRINRMEFDGRKA